MLLWWRMDKEEDNYWAQALYTEPWSGHIWWGDSRNDGNEHLIAFITGKLLAHEVQQCFATFKSEIFRMEECEDTGDSATMCQYLSDCREDDDSWSMMRKRLPMAMVAAQRRLDKLYRTEVRHNRTIGVNFCANNCRWHPLTGGIEVLQGIQAI